MTDSLTMKVQIKLGWRWELATTIIPRLIPLGLSVPRCVKILNWALRHVQIRTGDGRWSPVDLGEITISSLE